MNPESPEPHNTQTYTTVPNTLSYKEYQGHKSNPNIKRIFNPKRIIIYLALLTVLFFIASGFTITSQHAVQTNQTNNPLVFAGTICFIVTLIVLGIVLFSIAVEKAMKKEYTRILQTLPLSSSVQSSEPICSGQILFAVRNRYAPKPSERLVTYTGTVIVTVSEFIIKDAEDNIILNIPVKSISSLIKINYGITIVTDKPIFKLSFRSDNLSRNGKAVTNRKLEKQVIAYLSYCGVQIDRRLLLRTEIWIATVIILAAFIYGFVELTNGLSSHALYILCLIVFALYSLALSWRRSYRRKLLKNIRTDHPN